VVFEALVAKRVDIGVRKRAALMDTGNDPRTPGINGGVGEREPDREVLLRLDEGVTVVLMPGEPAGLLGLLVNDLVPVEANVGADKVSTYLRDRRVPADVAGRLGLLYRVRSEDDGTRLGNEHPFVGHRLEELVEALLDDIELVSDVSERGGIDEVFNNDPALVVELVELVVGEAGRSNVRPLPGKVGVPRMRTQGAYICTTG
jgi:hypothetical protein